MEHSAKYAAVKRWYDLGAWNAARVRNAVIKRWINEAEFEEIIGEVYTS